MSDSPLAGVNPASLDELFSRDPLGLSDQDIEQIVVELRAQRERFNAAEATGKRPTTAKPAKTAAPEGLSLLDLGL
jgi:hypothetical protein